MPRPNQGRTLKPRQPPGYAEPYWFIVWYERGKRKVRGTGVPCRDRRTVPPEAERALSDFIAADIAPGSRAPDEITVSLCLAIYGREKATDAKDPARIGYSILRLDPLLGHRKVSDITGKTCRDYTKARQRAGVRLGTIRRELGTLSAALRYCSVEGYLTAAPAVWLPPKPPPKDRWLTRSEAARLIRAARNGPARDHLPHVMLIGFKTGTRISAILNLQWIPNTSGGWVDLERGLIYRAPEGAAQTRKRQTPAPLPRTLIPHLRRLRKRTERYLIEYRGKRVLRIKRSFATACREAKLGSVTPHVMRHTAATWLAQSGLGKHEAAGYLGMTAETFDSVYAHHDPNFMAGARDVMDRR